MTAAAANRLGLECHVAVATDPPVAGGSSPGGNLLLDAVLGPSLHFVGQCDYYQLEHAIEALGIALVRDGHRPFVMPIGGASVTGVCAYADATDELRAQLGGTAIDWVVVADGSGGTHAGLLAGFGDEAQVLGVDVGTRPDLDAVVPRLAAEAAARTNRAPPTTSVHIDHDRFGEGYGVCTDDGLEAIRLAARLEGLVLDPVYTGKAMAGLIAAVRDGRFTSRDVVLFWHTGGAPALFATRYATALGP
jgi:1-aminocyclopropane-1-carboxylate deaminase/D-cysteine desulfhydrase-like pyridoxal-dependent ACC family enzyme